MKFKLRTLLIVVTCCSIAIAIWFHRQNHLRKLETHLATFRQVDLLVKQLDDQITPFVLQMPKVKQQLNQADPINPEIALGRSSSGISMFSQGAHFAKRFQYSWQRPDGSRYTGIRLTIESKMDESTFEPHRVKIFHGDTPESREVAQFVESKLDDLDHVEIEMEERDPLSSENQ